MSARAAPEARAAEGPAGTAPSNGLVNSGSGGGGGYTAYGGDGGSGIVIIRYPYPYAAARPARPILLD